MMYNKIVCRLHKDEGINAYLDLRDDGTKYIVIVCFVCNAHLFSSYAYLNSTTAHGELVEV